jgi:hypothetical protein
MPIENPVSCQPAPTGRAIADAVNLEAPQTSCLVSLKTMKKKRTEITIEIDEIMIVSRGRNASAQIWCPGCSAIATLVSPERAAGIAGVTVRTINRWVEAESVHFVETEDGLLLLCVNSLR